MPGVTQAFVVYGGMLFSEILSYDREGCQRHIVIDDVPDEQDNQPCVDTQTQNGGPLFGGGVHDGGEKPGYGNVAEDAFQGVRDGELALSDEVGQQHGCSISRHSSPCARHIAVTGDEQDIDKNQNHASDTREPCSPDGLVNQFVPE